VVEMRRPHLVPPADMRLVGTVPRWMLGVCREDVRMVYA
jgi:hypothetical protein